MTKGTFIGMTRATPENFEFSLKVPETITHIKRLDIKKEAMTSFDEFLDISFKNSKQIRYGTLQVLRLLILRTLNNFWIGCRLVIAMITHLTLDILPGALQAPGKCSGITIL